METPAAAEAADSMEKLERPSLAVTRPAGKMRDTRDAVRPSVRSVPLTLSLLWKKSWRTTAVAGEAGNASDGKRKSRSWGRWRAQSSQSVRPWGHRPSSSEDRPTEVLARSENPGFSLLNIT